MATTTPNYAVDYEDKRLTNIKSEEQTQLEQNAQMYDGMIQGVDEQYKGIADTIQSNADKLAQTQQENTDFQVQQIEQQKEQAQKDYTKEQSGSYVDFQKQSNQYGVNAEQMAMQGLAGSGYSESSKVAMYNQYQNRVAVARETLSKVIMNYDNNIQQAILQNNSTIAQIQSEASLKQAEILLEGFNQKNTLLQQQAEREMQLKSFYQNKWQSELNQINTENALAEQVRQAQIEQENDEKNYQLALKEAESQAKYREEQTKLAQQQQTLAEKEFKAKYGANGTETKVAEAQVKALTPAVKEDTGTKISTQYYSGQIAENVGGFGYMGKDNNGVAYQPKGVYENGKAVKLQKSGKTAKQMFGKGITNSSGVNIESQNVWKGDKYYYIWNGTRNTYEIVGYV